jgi:nitroreductase
MNLYEAIFARKSVRKYSMDKIDQKVLDHIANFAESIPMLSDDIKVKYKMVELAGLKRLQPGILTVKAPHYLVLYSTTESDYQLNAGYVMEQIALYITARGLGCCYIANLNLKSETVAEGYEQVITLAFGEAENEVYRQNEKARRLAIKDIAVFKEEVDKNVRAMISAARLSPSVLNSQPWRMVVYNNRIHLFSTRNILMKNVMKETRLIDMGICLSHLLIAAEEMWLDAKPVYMNNISSQNLKKNDYIISVKMS